MLDIGSLVVKKSRWGIDSKHIGIIVRKSTTSQDCCIVLWVNVNMNYKLQEHKFFALIDLYKISNNLVEARGHITL